MAGSIDEDYVWLFHIFLLAMLIVLAFFAWVYYFDCVVEGSCWLHRLFGVG